MKNILIIISFVILLPLATNAAGKTKMPDVRKYKTELNLTEDQMNRLNTVYNNFDARAKLQAPAQTGRERMEQRMQLRKEMRKEIAQVLTKEQRQAYIQIMQNNQQRKQQKQQ
ncbi:MAG: hypothetical protein JW798_09160 [Prolixibacteraceae bacterium]|nr:hypothetical protein [Prolixibacteraceae bacterium]